MKKHCILIVFIVGAVFAHLAWARVDGLKRIEDQMIASGKYKEALSFIENIPEEETSARVIMDRGIAYYGLGEYSIAYDEFIKAEKARPSQNIRDMLDHVLSKTDKNMEILSTIEVLNKELADADAEETEEIKEQIAGLHFIAINTLVEDNHYYPSLVVPHIRWLKDNMESFKGLHLLSADLLYTAMFYKEASNDYKKALEEDRDNIRLTKTLADCLVAMGDYSSARTYYDRTIELYLAGGMDASSPEVLNIRRIQKAFPDTYSEIGDLISQGKYFDAEKAAKKRLSLNSGDTTALIQLGNIYWETDRRKHAIKIFRKVINISPENPFGYFYLGKAYIFERKPRKGMKNFDSAIKKMELMPDKDEETIDIFVSALRYMSYIYSIYGTREESLRAAKKGLELKPEDPYTHYNLAVIYYNDFYDRVKAYGELQKVIEISPDSELARKAKQFIDYMRRYPDARVSEEFSIQY